jgi:hypothetical protein
VLSTRFIFALILFLTPSLAIAQVPLKKGQEAPDDGVFLDKEQAARLISNAEAAQKTCTANIDREVQRCTINNELENKKLTIELQAARERSEILEKIRNGEIESLKKAVEEARGGQYNQHWFSAGLFVGLVVSSVVSIAIFYAAVQTSNSAN